MELVDIRRPLTAPPLEAEPLQSYLANFRRAHQDSSMTLSARYQRVQDGQSAFSDQASSAEESDATLRSTSSDSHIPTDGQADPLPPSWSRQLWTTLSRPFSSSSNNKIHSLYLRQYERVIYDKVEDFEEGIPQLAALLSSHENYGIFRGFFPYATRILLHRSIELDLLVKKLNNLDKEEAAQPDREYKLRTVKLKPESDAERIKLLKELEVKLSEYYCFYTKYANIRALAPSPQHSQRSVHNWMLKNQPLVDGQNDFILHVTDLVSATKKFEPNGLHGSPIEAFIENHAINNENSLFNRLLTATDDRNKSDNPWVHMYSHQRLENITRTLTVIIAVGFLLTPVFILFLVAMSRAAMVLTVFAFVLAFSIMMSLVSGARTQDLLLGTAALGHSFPILIT